MIKTVLYWIWSFTWNCIMSVCGGLTALFFLIRGFKPKRFLYGLYFVIPGNWGGISMGLFFFVSEDTPYYTYHEYGHTLEGLLFGPFQVVFSLISLVRCWLFQYTPSYVQYDDWWFEGCATHLGTKAVEKRERKIKALEKLTKN